MLSSWLNCNGPTQRFPTWLSTPVLVGRTLSCSINLKAMSETLLYLSLTMLLVSSGQAYVVCGDDKGKLWTYHVTNLQKSSFQTGIPILPTEVSIAVQSCYCVSLFSSCPQGPVLMSLKHRVVFTLKCSSTGKSFCPQLVCKHRHYL